MQQQDRHRVTVVGPLFYKKKMREENGRYIGNLSKSEILLDTWAFSGLELSTTAWGRFSRAPGSTLWAQRQKPSESHSLFNFLWNGHSKKWPLFTAKSFLQAAFLQQVGGHKIYFHFVLPLYPLV